MKTLKFEEDNFVDTIKLDEAFFCFETADNQSVLVHLLCYGESNVFLFCMGKESTILNFEKYLF
jgi:hypothetical protein